MTDGCIPHTEVNWWEEQCLVHANVPGTVHGTLPLALIQFIFVELNEIDSKEVSDVELKHSLPPLPVTFKARS
jgi:hypothetical protein